MKRISLSQDKFVLVDDADYGWLSPVKWYCVNGHKNYYAVRHSRSKSGQRIIIYMHREILGLQKGDRKQTDHADGNGLNNQRKNLRLCTSSQNQWNRKQRKGTSKFKGVYWCKVKKKWRAEIQLKGKKIRLGRFNDETVAAETYDLAAKKYFGEYAKTNF